MPFPPEALSPVPFALPNHELMLLPVFPICPEIYRIEFCLLAVGKTKNDLLVVLLDHLIINEKESEGLWWSTAIRNRERKKMRKREKSYKR